MPVFDIQTPDGKVLSIEAPDEANALAGAQQWHAQNSGPAAAPQQPNAEPSMLERVFPKYGIAHAVANGMTFGALPNITAGVAAGAQGVRNITGFGEQMPVGERYDQVLQSQQDARRDFEQQHPFVNTASGVLGGVATGSTLAKNGLSLAGRAIESGAGKLAQAGAAAAEGAAYGGAAGFGGAEGGFENRAKAGAEGAAVGSAFGAATPSVMRGLDAVGGAVKNWWTGLRNPELQGERLLVQRLMQSGETPQGVANKVQAAQDLGVQDYTALDAAPKNVQKLGGVAIRTPSQFRDTGSEFLATRNAAQPDRLQTHLDAALGQGDSAFATEQGLIANRRAAAQPLYDAAYAEPTPSGNVFDDLRGKQSVVEAIAGARRVAAEKQVPITDLFTDVPNPNPQTRLVPTGVLDPNGRPVMQTQIIDPTISVPTVRGWDFIKRELDAQVNQLYRAGDTTAAGATKETRDALRSALSFGANGNLTPYGQALRAYSDDTAALEAVQTGRDVAKAANPDAALAEYSQLSPEKQVLARLGASREMGVKLDNSRPGIGNINALNTPNSRRKLDALVPDQTARAILSDKLAREAEMARVANDMLGGSQTAERIGDAMHADTGALVSALATGRHLTAAGRVLDPLLRAGIGLREAGANRVGEILTSRDPQAISALSDLFRQMETAARPSANTPAMVLGGALAPRQNTGREKR